ncbi:MAG: DUF370 domain-containing protein [Clostridiales bacterium]|nr:DUF370 domain-containing protein [Clostridiales bacterium]
MRFIDIGFGNIAAASRIICVSSSDSAPARRMIQDAKDRGACVDCCAGKKCRSVIVMDTDAVILSSVATEDIRKSLEEAS